MARGQGYGRLLAERGGEQAKEKARYERELELAERKRRIGAERESGWGLAGSLLGGLFGGPLGMVVGKGIGSFGADQFDDSEKYKVSTEAGRFGRSQKHELENINRQLSDADRASDAMKWKDLGTTALSAFTLGGGSLTDPSKWGDFSFTKFGGKGSEWGAGLFGKGDTGKSLLDVWKDKFK